MKCLQTILVCEVKMVKLNEDDACIAACGASYEADPVKICPEPGTTKSFGRAFLSVACTRLLVEGVLEGSQRYYDVPSYYDVPGRAISNYKMEKWRRCSRCSLIGHQARSLAGGPRRVEGELAEAAARFRADLRHLLVFLVVDEA